MNRRKFIKRSAAGVAGLSIALDSMGRVFSAAEKAIFADQPFRTIYKVIPAQRVQVSPTLQVGRTLPYGRAGIIDPFIMLDHFGPIQVKKGEGIEVPPHPHRGFEPVTFLVDGHVEHKDSLKNTGLLDAGGVQWMTAGSGIVHSEDLAKRFDEAGGTLHGVQLWVNLPQKDKMAAPGYQNIQREDIPEVTLEAGQGTVKVMAGTFAGVTGPAKTFTPILALMMELQPGARVEIPLPMHYNAFYQVLSGEFLAGKHPVSGSQLVFFNPDGQKAVVEAASNAESPQLALFLAGQPINEPVYQYGPFVMNSRDEIEAAYRDYQEGKMGEIDF